MVIIAFATYPPESAKEMGKRFIKLSPVPDFIKVEGPYMYSNGDDGIQAASLYKFDKSKAAEVLQIVNDQYAAFFGVPGYQYDIKVCAGAERGLKVAGVS
jgi:hypothetical protein